VGRGSSVGGAPSKSKVFISCGQANRQEIKIASKIGGLLRSRGFHSYIAKKVLTVFEINSGIIRELKDSDCYLFVNFRRERIGPGEFRGSLFSNQEFAIAYALGFERLLVINQKGVKPEGMLAYIGCNTDGFDKPNGCLKAVKKALEESNWKPDYSRRLIAGKPSFSDLVLYSDGLTQVKGRILYLDILNHRPDMAALETTARLKNLRQAKTKTWMASEIRSPLKATRGRGYSHTIFPSSSEAFDLLCIGESSDAAGQTKAFLNCALDLLPKPCVPITSGVWELEYEFYAIGFPVLRVMVEVTWSPNGQLAAKILRQNNS
jgi:hypothetical protein